MQGMALHIVAFAWCPHPNTAHPKRTSVNLTIHLPPLLRVLLLRVLRSPHHVLYSTVQFTA